MQKGEDQGEKERFIAGTRIKTEKCKESELNKGETALLWKSSPMDIEEAASSPYTRGSQHGRLLRYDLCTAFDEHLWELSTQKCFPHHVRDLQITSNEV